MRSLSSIVAATALAGAVAGCAQPQTYPRYSYSQAAYYPATTTYYTTPATTYSYPVTTTTYYSNPPNYQRSNVYSSQWDYYRNYQGIHDGPERTGP
jgi:hypothetical protein